MPYFFHDNTRIHFRDKGEGVPFVFLHGLGADLEQPFSLFAPAPGCRMISFDCRAHGLTESAASPEEIGLARFADDLIALLDYLHIERAIVGGVSMGAAVALNLASRFPSRMMGLVQLRPAWTAGPNYENAVKFQYVAGLLRELGPESGKRTFQQSDMYQQLQRESPDAAKSLSSQFDSPRCVERAARLERLPLDAPLLSMEELDAIIAPTLVMAHRGDPIHDYAHGEALAAAMAGSEFYELTPKSVDLEHHCQQVQTHIGQFIDRHFLAPSVARFDRSTTTSSTTR